MRWNIFLGLVLILLIVGINQSIPLLASGELHVHQVDRTHRIEETSLTPLSGSVIRVPETPECRAISIRGLTVKGIHITGELCINKENWLRPKLIEAAKEMGANWVQLVLWVEVTEEGKLIECARSIYGPSDFSSMEDFLEESQKTEELMVSLI